MSIKIDLKGFDLVEPKVFLAVQKGLNRFGTQVIRDAKIFAPWDTGYLKSSIGPMPIIEGLTMWITAHAPYAGYMELPGNVRKSGQRPYMEPALFTNLNNLNKFIQEEIRNVLK